MRILLDVDGVLADWHSAALTVCNEIVRLQTGSSEKGYLHDDVDEWALVGWIKARHPEFDSDAFNARVDSTGWVSGLLPYPGAVSGVRALAEIPNAEVVYVTSPTASNPTWHFERTNWLRSHFGAEKRQIVATSAKHLIRGDLFVDDKVANVDSWDAANSDGMAVLFDRPYNKRESWKGRRVGSLFEVAEIAERLAHLR